MPSLRWWRPAVWGAAIGAGCLAASAYAAPVSAVPLNFLYEFAWRDGCEGTSSYCEEVVAFHITSDIYEFASLTRNNRWRKTDQVFVFTQQAPGLVPLFRYRSRAGKDHFFTTSQSEGDQAVVRFDYVPEGTCCFILASQAPQSMPLFRMQKDALHRYTANPQLREELRQQGWNDEGVVGFVFTHAGPWTLQ